MKALRVTFAGAVAVLGMCWFASTALAAFPGANGLLAVQPVSGGGILLVNSNGDVVRRICTVRTRCGTPRRPRWSPDGRAIVFAGPGIRIIYPDGSCMNCQFGAAANPAFTPGGTVISFLQRDRVTLDGIDGLREPAPGVHGVTNAVWSADGEFAVVRRGAVWAGPPGRLRRIALGGDPSWSPSGDRLAIARRGWVVIVRMRNGHVQRVARGSAPAFSPDGRWIAFAAPDRRLMGVAASGGRPEPVGRIRALSVDWQPRPPGPNPGCASPPGSTMLATSAQAVLTDDGFQPESSEPSYLGPSAVMGCLRADGRERLLERFGTQDMNDVYSPQSAVLAPPFGALVVRDADPHYGGYVDTVEVFDLRAGVLRKHLGGESADCIGECATLDDVVLGSDGVSAAHTWTALALGDNSTPFDHVACPPAGSVCVAADETGKVFTSSDPTGGRQSWRTRTGPPGPDLDGVACPSLSLCVGPEIIASGTDIWTSSNPGGGSVTWKATALSADVSNGISCPTVSLCVAIGPGGGVATSTKPAGARGAWTVRQIDRGQALHAVVCSSQPRCFITDYAGKVFTSGDPARAWTLSASTPPFQAGTCPSATLCVTVTGRGIATTTDPSAGTWTQQPGTPSGLVGVTCPDASLCVAVGAAGQIWTTTNPASSNWTAVGVDHGLDLTSVSCSSRSLCVATDDNGHVLASTNPTGGASAWTSTLLEGDACTSASDCTMESVQASDRTGVHTVDHGEFMGPGPVFTGLALKGDTLSWSHAGSPRTATLTPP